MALSGPPREPSEESTPHPPQTAILTLHFQGERLTRTGCVSSGSSGEGQVEASGPTLKDAGRILFQFFPSDSSLPPVGNIVMRGLRPRCGLASPTGSAVRGHDIRGLRLGKGNGGEAGGDAQGSPRTSLSDYSDLLCKYVDLH